MKHHPAKEMTRLRRTLLAVTLSALASQAAATDFSRLTKEIEIVKGILDTSLKQQRGGDGLRYRSLDATYLADQGVVFSVTTSGSGNWMSQLSSFVDRIPPMPEVPAAPVIVHGADIDIELSREWEAFADETAARFEDAFAQSAEQMHDLRSDEREVAWEKRDIERRQRDLEFELSRVDAERGKEIKQTLKELDKEAEKLKQKADQLQARLATIEKTRNEKLEARKEAKEKAVRTFLSNFENGVGEALCHFGGGMRALPKDEYITFVLKGFVSDDRQNVKDKVYVFSKDDINDCVAEKISAEKLLNGAQVYDF